MPCLPTDPPGQPGDLPPPLAVPAWVPQRQPGAQPSPAGETVADLVCEAMYWMTEHALTGEPALCSLVLRKLAALERLDPGAVPPPLARARAQLLARWSELAHAYAELERDDTPCLTLAH